MKQKVRVNRWGKKFNSVRFKAIRISLQLSIFMYKVCSISVENIYYCSIKIFTDNRSCYMYVHAHCSDLKTVVKLAIKLSHGR